MYLYKINMEVLGIVGIVFSVWLAQFLSDSEKKKEQEIEKRIKEKMKNDQYINIRIIEKP